MSYLYLYICLIWAIYPMFSITESYPSQRRPTYPCGGGSRIREKSGVLLVYWYYGHRNDCSNIYND